MDISVWGARKSNGIVSACAYITMEWYDEESDKDVSERAYITYAYSRSGGALKFSEFTPNDITLKTYEAMRKWDNERRLQLALASMTDYAINNNLEA